MASILNSIVKNYLSEFLEIDTEKTKTKIFSGIVELENIKFKKTFFNSINVPFLELEDGYIGKIKLELSLPRFYLYPIILNLDKIYVRIKPKNINKITKEEILKINDYFKDLNLRKLEKKLKNKFKESKNEEAEKASHQESYIDKIINNLYINISKIVLIFDDCLSDINHPYLFGVTLNEIKVESTSKDFTKIQKEDKNSPLKYKKLSINNLNIFLDRQKIPEIKDNVYDALNLKYKNNFTEDIKEIQEKEKYFFGELIFFYLYCEKEINDLCKKYDSHNYLLRGLIFDLKLIINTKYPTIPDNPQFDIQMEMKNVNTQISTNQIKSSMNILNYLKVVHLFQNAVISNHYSSKNKLSQEIVKDYLENYILYYKTKYIKKYKNKNKNKIYEEKIKKVEVDLDLKTIIKLREICTESIENLFEESEQGKTNKENDENSPHFNFNTEKELEDLKAENDKKIHEKKKLERKNSMLFKMKSQIKEILDKRKSGDNKDDIVEFKLSFTINKFIFELYENQFNDSEDNILLFRVKFIQFEFLFLLKKNSEYIKLSLKDWIVSQYLSETKYQNILYSSDSNTDISNDKININTYVIFFEFEHNPYFESSPFKIKLSIDKQFKLIVDYYYIFYIMNLLLNCFKNFKLNERTFFLENTILDTVKNAIDIKNRERDEKKNKKKIKKDDGINFGESLVINNLKNTYKSISGISDKNTENERTFNADIDILIKTPIILLPLNFRNGDDKSFIYLSLGQLQLYNKLSGIENNGLIYDRYIIELTDIKAAIIPDLITNKTTKSMEILSPCSFKITLDKYIYNGLNPFISKNNNNFPINVNLEFSTIVFSLNEDHLIFLMNYLKNLKFTQSAINLKFQLKKDLPNIKKNNEFELNKDEIPPDENIQINNINEPIKSREIYNSLELHTKFESIEFHLLKNITEKEEEYLNNFNKKEGNKNIEKYKSFLSVIFKFTKLNLNLTSNGSMDIDFSFGHFFLYDNDFYFDSNLNRIRYINPELKYIIGTSSYLLLNSDEKDKQKIKISDFFENQEMKNNSQSIKIKFKLVVDEGKEMTLDIKMNKLILIPNLSTTTRVVLFVNKYLNIYTETIKQIIDNEANNLEILNRKKNKKAGRKMKIFKNNVTITDGITIKFEMEGVDIYLPVEPEKNNTTMFNIFAKIPTEFSSLKKKQIIQEKNLLKIIYIINRSELKLNLSKGEIKLYDYIDDNLSTNNEKKLLNYENITFGMQKELDPNKMLISKTISLKTQEIIDMSFNLNHFLSAIILFNSIKQFIHEISKLKELNLDEEIINKELNEIIQKRKINIIKKKAISNLEECNKITYYDINIPDLFIDLNDYIDGEYQPIFRFKLKINDIDFCRNRNPQDSTNLQNYLKNIFLNENLSLNNYDKLNCYRYLKLKTSFEFKYFNNILHQMEDFIEPFEMEFSYFQILKRMRAKIELKFKKMLNINISTNLAKIIRYFLEKMYQLNLERKNLQKLKENKKKIDDNISIKTPLAVFENFSGIDINLWFDNNKDENDKKVINLKDQIKFEIFKENLNEYNLYKINNNFSNTFSYELSINDDRINQKNLSLPYYNINYSHLDLHKINNDYQISVENYIDNFLCRHIIFNSLIIIKNETRYSNIKLSNFNETLKFNVDTGKKKSIPLNWLFDEDKKVFISLDDDVQVLAEDISNSEKINKNITFKNGDVISINILKYKFNLEEHNINSTTDNAKNTGAESINNKEIYKYEIILTSPIYIKNNTPYEIEIMNNNIDSCGNTNIYKINPKLCINILESKERNKEIIEILKDIDFKLIYNNKKFSPIDSFEEKNKTDSKSKVINKHIINSISILLEDSEKNFLICRFYINDPYDSIIYDMKKYDDFSYEINSQSYEIAFDYYFVNRTNFDLNINNEESKKIKSVYSNYESEERNIILEKKLFTPVSKVVLHKKIKIKNTESNWSDEFESRAVGNDFTITMNNKNEIYSFGIMIRISSIFTKSFVITIEDKYQIINDLLFDIKLKSSSGTILNLKTNQHEVLVLDKDSIKNKIYYQIGVDETYTKMIDIDKVGSYDLLLKYSDELNIPKNIKIEEKLIELNENKYYPIRCIIYSLNKNTNFILFTYNPEFLLKFKNSSTKKLSVVINDDKDFSFAVKPNEVMPLIYYNKKNEYESFDKITIIDEENKDIKNTISLTDFSPSYFGNYICMVIPKNNNSNKVIEITEVIEKVENINLDKNEIKKLKLEDLSGYDFKLYLNGIGLSIIDETPKEVFFLSIYEIEINYNYYKKNNLSLSESSNIITVSVKNMQLDYCLENSYKCVFCPSNQILPEMLIPSDKNKEVKIENIIPNIPFIQMNLFQKVIKDNETDKKMYTVYPEITVIVQEFEVSITTIVINTIIDLCLKYKEILLSDNLTNSDNIIKLEDKKLITDNYSDQNINIIKETLVKIINKTLIIDSLLLSAVKMNLTFRLDRDAINFKYLPDVINTLLYTVCSTLSLVSECSLSLNELIMTNINNDMKTLKNILKSFYKMQILKQIYKIIGGLDLLGNPVKLLEGIGAGVFSLINEPRKGILKSPVQFYFGLYKGTSSLLTGLVGGTLNTVSKLTGSLLHATKNLSNLCTKGESPEYEDGPKGVIDGTVTGLKKGIGELSSGLTGVVTKPIEEAKKGGVFGFIKGVGSGILGVALSPVNTVLALGKNLTEGIANSEIINSKKTLKRFREPRVLCKFLLIMPYGSKEELESRKGIKYKYKDIEIGLNNEDLFLENSTKIVNYEQLKDKSQFVFTDMLIKIYSQDFKVLKAKIYIKNITNIEVKEKNDLEIITKDGMKNIISLNKKDSPELLKDEINNLLKN